MYNFFFFNHSQFLLSLHLYCTHTVLYTAPGHKIQITPDIYLQGNLLEVVFCYDIKQKNKL